MTLKARWLHRRREAAYRRSHARDLAGALRSIKWTQRLAPRSAEPLLVRAILTWDEAGDGVEESKALVRRAAALAGDDPGMLVRCATMMVGLGGVDEIEAWVARANAAAARDFALDNELVHLNGCVHWARGEYDEAETLLRTAFFADPTSVDGYPLAQTYVELGSHDQALAIVEEALRRGGRHPGLLELREWLARQPPPG